MSNDSYPNSGRFASSGIAQRDARGRVTFSARSGFLRLTAKEESLLIDGARDCAPVKGLTHGFYKYPARFSPSFVRNAIKVFTAHGDLVLDNHVGGGTTLVEALAAGRHAVGVDVSTLAEFVSIVKTTIFAPKELDRLDKWGDSIASAINLKKSTIHFPDYYELGYYKHLDHASRWRLRKAIEQGIWHAIKLNDPRLEAFGRCAVLKVAQWALDGRSKQTTVEAFRNRLEATAREMTRGARELRSAALAQGSPPASVKVLNRSSAGLETDKTFHMRQAPRLVITSPPYPGVHILYHRFQVDGRKEAPLPFMIADKLDGAMASYYTMGDRKHPKLASYFENIKATMSSVAALADDKTIVVQMLAFGKREWQLPRYLETMEEAGLREVFLPSLSDEGDGRLWRAVPGRRWYSDQRGQTPASREVVLIHVKK